MTAGSFVKTALRRLAPSLAERIRSWRIRRYSEGAFGALRADVRREAFADSAPRVLGGPFAGLLYLDEPVWGSIAPKWVGSYEEELHGIVVDEILRTESRTVVDVGAAEGYYAVGIAWKRPDVTVHAFDIDPLARDQQKRLARLNGVSNLHVHAECAPEELERLLKDGGVVICDVEGFEYALLDPVRIPSLRVCDVLTELHPAGERSADEVRDALRERFEATHRITTLDATPREPERYRECVGPTFPQSLLTEAVGEHRPASQQWLWMEAQARPAGVAPPAEAAAS
ncbi:hypothetical protein ACG2DA_17275, partial [Alienimonas sp. DA493]